jgi:hypothetical protein
VITKVQRLDLSLLAIAVVGGTLLSACSSSGSTSTNSNTAPSETKVSEATKEIQPADEIKADQQALKDLNFGLAIYTADNEDVYPIADSWHDGLKAYLKEKNPMRAKAESGGFAFNTKMSNVSATSINMVKNTPVVFSSTKTERNAHDICESFYFYSDGTTMIGFPDGSVFSLKPGDKIALNAEGKDVKVIKAK